MVNTGYDFVDVMGTAVVDGELQLSLIDGFVPSPDDEFIVFNSDDLSGFFSNAGNGQRVDTTDGLGSFVVHYGPTSMFLERQNQIVLTNFVLAGLPGDYNDDGVVNAADYVLWRNSMSDDSAGYDAWRTNFGGTNGSGAIQASVPEPESVLLLALAIAGLYPRCRVIRHGSGPVRSSSLKC